MDSDAWIARMLQELPVRHTLDLMHMEKNVATTLLGLLLGDDDTIAVRKDLENIGARPELHLVRQGDSDSYLMPHAPYVLRAEERTRVLEVIKNVQTPKGHCGNFDKLVNLEKKKLQFMKTHDYHVLLQEILPVAIRGSLDEGPRVAIIRLAHCFKRFCDKVIRRRELTSLLTYVAETMALIEIHFPPTFWNISPHLIVHVPRELYWCGPVHARWMYGVERYLGHLKSLVRNRAKPEGSMAMGYMMEEALGFVTDHFGMYPGRARVIWTMEEDEKDAGEVLEGNDTDVVWSELDIQEVHDHIITHSTITESMFR